MKIPRLLLLSALGSTLVACASTYQSPAIAPEETATITLYRTRVAFHSLNLERPFFYIDGQKVGQLGTGDSLSVPVAPGEHVVTVKESMLFMPTFEVGRIELNAGAGETYYIRYSMEFSGLSSNGMQTVPVGSSKFSPATREQFESRQ